MKKYRAAKSEYYDGVRTRYYEEYQLLEHQVTEELEGVALRANMLYEALNYMRHLRRDWTAEAVTNYVNYIILRVFHEGLEKDYIPVLRGMNIDPDKVFFDREVEKLSDIDWISEEDE